MSEEVFGSIEGKEGLEAFDDIFGVIQARPGSYSPLVLAYIGDAIYELMIRSYMVKQGNKPVNKLHKMTKDYVKASAQKDLYFRIKDMLTEEEISIFKRGRNAKSATKAKNATVSDYKTATGLEALFGYLYLKGDVSRIMRLIVGGIKDE